jgi:hypothetical protein
LSFGVIINESTAPAASGVPVDTGTVFVAGVVAAAPTPPTTPVLIASMADYEAYFGPRTGAEVGLWDWCDVAFREGAAEAYISAYTTAGNYQPALDLLDSRYGPGQVAVVGEPASATVYAALQAHADSNNRIGLLDVTEGDDLTKLLAHGSDAQSLSNMENVGVFGSWGTCAGPAGVVSSTGRIVPASAAIAGLCNRVDQAGNPGRAAGGKDFPLQYLNGFEMDPGDSDRTQLFQNGVNMFANRWGTLENYGFVTPIYKGQPIASTPFWQLNCARTRMAMKAQAQAIGEPYYMRTLDGQGKLANELKSDLQVMCANYWEADALFGATKDEAYSVNVGTSVNTSQTVAQATLVATVEARLSQYAMKVVINLVSVPVAGVVS